MCRKAAPKFKHVKLAAREEGTIIVLFAAFLVMLIGMTALMTDLPLWLRAKQEVQNVADGAALAGAMQLSQVPLGGPGNLFVLSPVNAPDAAYAYCDKYPDTHCEVSTNPLFNTVSVEARRPVQVFFARAIGIESFDVHAMATARMVAGY
jgi:Flp pilus assembly protein TadG